MCFIYGQADVGFVNLFLSLTRKGNLARINFNVLYTCILLLRIDSNSSLDMRGTDVTRSINSLPTLLSPGTFPA